MNPPAPLLTLAVVFLGVLVVEWLIEWRNTGAWSLRSQLERSQRVAEAPEGRRKLLVKAGVLLYAAMAAVVITLGAHVLLNVLTRGP